MRVLGLGSGRCGTHSLGKLLSLQPGLEASHERFPALDWEGDPEPDRHLRRENAADVGFYYLNYAEELLESFPDMKAVCLIRPRRETVASFVRHRAGGINWFDPEQRPDEWSRCFPKYRGLDFASAVDRYWCEYYGKALMLVGDRFQLFRTELFNSQWAVAGLLEWLGIASPVVEVGIREASTTEAW